MSVLVHERQQQFTQPGELLATWWRQKTPGSYYWRTLVPARALPGQTLFFHQMTDWKDTDPKDPDSHIDFPRLQGASVWQFAGNATTATLLRVMQLQGTRVLMEVDDNYLMDPDVGMSRDWQADFDRDGQSDKFSYAAHASICRWVDGVIVSTPELAEVYGQLNENVHVCRNSVDPADWPETEREDDGILRIGWAASHSHIVDAPLVRRALMWAAEQKDVEVYVYGIGDVARFPGAVKKVPWTDSLTDYRASLARLDVQVCPLIETQWSRGKSDVKALEAAMAGSWPIVSAASPYKPWHEQTMVCGGKRDWLAALRWAVLHRDEIPALAAKAKAYVMGERLIEHEIGKWRQAVA